MSATTTTEEMTVTLPKELADLVRAEMALRHYATPVEYLTHAVAETTREAAGLEDWMRTVAVARYDAYDSDPGNVFSGEEVRRAVTEKLRPLAKTG